MTGRLAGLLFLLAVIALGLIYFAVSDREPIETRLVLNTRAFSSLDGWEADDQAPALAAFVRGCQRILSFPPGREMGARGMAGTAGDWSEACEAAGKIPPGDSEAARQYFQVWFRPVAVANNRDDIGQFTGYYTPTLRGSRTPSERYSVPLYAPPDDYVTADLGKFDASLAGRRIVGRLRHGRLVPVETRAEIEDGALDGRAQPILWVDDPIDAFFLHIQGSGVVRLDDGTEVTLGVAGTNGHTYQAIGRVLAERGALAPDDISAQSIRTWLAAHPDDAGEVMRANPRFIFFATTGSAAAAGSAGVALTPGRSLAIDRNWLALGVPVWLDTALDKASGGPARIRRLMVAQDTGGAIKGIVRGDVYWGAGDAAADIAGRMNEAGRYFVLLPRALVAGRQ